MTVGPHDEGVLPGRAGGRTGAFTFSRPHPSQDAQGQNISLHSPAHPRPVRSDSVLHTGGISLVNQPYRRHTRSTTRQPPPARSPTATLAIEERSHERDASLR